MRLELNQLNRKYFRILYIISFMSLALYTVYEYGRVISINNITGKNELDSLSDRQLVEFFENQRYLKHELTVQSYYEKRKSWATSNLGSIMYKNTPQPAPNNKTFVVLVWKYYDWLKNRHVKSFDHGRTDPLDECSVKNCLFIGDNSKIHTANAVLVHIQHGEIPAVSNRNPDQLWVFLSDESPKNKFTMARGQPNLADWDHKFNWSMTYRSDADVPVPYGRTLALKSPLMRNTLSETVANYVPHWKYKRRDVLVTVLMSNCHVSDRMRYLKSLQKHINVTVYGKCSEDNKKSCPGHFKEDCEVVNEYLFYLVFENSQCRQYLTEKSFHNAYKKGAIPIIMGPPLEDCENLLPPNSFLHVDNYDSAEFLAKDIMRISKSDDSLLGYHQWRNDFEIVNEHGYFGSKSFHYCRLCEALNYNNRTRTSYSLLDLELFLDIKMLCKT
ncbi:unnamed protein product [Chilo suppressalis]|uniref:Fucosyltransferase n=1 Tax=Chilo suppressalis TaxID=168631 RepID=A0ABN8L9Y7_CHISP|nr:unnamed protein product [Chilo suppressalis]